MEFRGERVEHPLLDRLYRFDKEIVPSGSDTFESGLGAVGLILNKKLDQSRYPGTTPVNCVTFAHTGGECVHFSLLTLDRGLSEKSPVVVSIPSFCPDNFVVGEDLHDFLCLGCLRGYFALEQLAFHPYLTLEVYTNGTWQPSEPWHDLFRDYPSENQRRILRLLTETLGLRPWTGVSRFGYLQEKYRGMLEISEAD